MKKRFLEGVGGDAEISGDAISDWLESEGGAPCMSIEDAADDENEEDSEEEERDEGTSPLVVAWCWPGAMLMGA